MDYREVLDEIHAELDFSARRGEVARYIPELGRVDPDQYGLCLMPLDGRTHTLGQASTAFSVQSITKVFTLALAMKHFGARIWRRINVEPSGSPFNSLVQLEYEEGIPRNPLINAGALVLADLLVEACDRPAEDFLAFVRRVSGSPGIDFNRSVADSERDHGYRNRALANLLKSFGNIHNEVDEVLDFYFLQCSLEMSCEQLARAFGLFATGGMAGGERVLSRLQSQRVNALMQTCGFYDEAGEFAFRIGLPGKSGVGGGIAAVYPGQYSVAVWSPRLNPRGNSLLGMKTLELLTTKTGMAIF